MSDKLKSQLLSDFLLAERAVSILEKSAKKSLTLLEEAKTRPLTDDDRETFESLTSRFGRALDFMLQKLLRTIDRIELTDDGSLLDRVNRFKKRGVLQDQIDYAILKDLRNQIVHEYIIDETDRVVADVLQYVSLVRDIYDRAKEYCARQHHL
jgi:hypothetical protein